MSCQLVCLSIIGHVSGEVTASGSSRTPLPPQPKYKMAVQQVFGRALLCKGISVATGYAKSHGLTCVTLDGDVVERKGAMKGGYLEAEGTAYSHAGRLPGG